VLKSASTKRGLAELLEMLENSKAELASENPSTIGLSARMQAYFANNPAYLWSKQHSDGKNDAAQGKTGETKDPQEPPVIEEPEDPNDPFSGPFTFGKKADDASKARAAAAGGKKMPLQDNVATLTRRLVAAKVTFTVQQIISEASKDIGSLRLAAMGNDNEAATARRIIRKLERLMRRCSTKVTNLNNEDNMRRKRDKAERESKVQRAKQIESELRQKILRRKNRESGYIRELNRESAMEALEKTGKSQNTQGKLDAATEAKIAAQAMAMAASQTSAGSGGSGDAAASGGHSGSEIDGAVPGGSPDSSGGIEGAIAGSVDISV